MINVQVDKNNNENNVSLIKRFTKKVQGAGILNRVRGIRYNVRNSSKNTNKKRALKSIARKKVTETLIKLGKMPEKTFRR